MTGNPHRPKKVRVALAALLVLLVAFAPTLLFGELLSPSGLLMRAAGVFGIGMILRLGGRGEVRALGWVLVAIGVVLLVVGVGVLALALGSWGRPY